jgi:hypothetical protein
MGAHRHWLSRRGVVSWSDAERSMMIDPWKLDTNPDWHKLCSRWVTVLAEMTRMGGTRRGQAVFNALAHVDNNLADTLVNSRSDCFYEDALIDEFVLAAHAAWQEGR